MYGWLENKLYKMISVDQNSVERWRERKAVTLQTKLVALNTLIP